MSNEITVKIKGSNDTYRFKGNESVDQIKTVVGLSNLKQKLNREMSFSQSGPKSTKIIDSIKQHIKDVMSGKIAIDGLKRLDALGVRMLKGDREAGIELVTEFGAAGAISRAIKATKPLFAYHGTDAPGIKKFNLEKFGTGGFERLKLGTSGTSPAVYLTTEKKHASAYGENIHSFNVDTKNPLIIDAHKELREWMEDEFPGKYSTVQEMIDDYYGGDIYKSFDTDARLADAISEAQKTGKDSVVMDFSNLKDSTVGKLGKIIAVTDTSRITPAE